MGKSVKCKKHPTYQALRRPRANCNTCEDMWKQELRHLATGVFLCEKEELDYTLTVDISPEMTDSQVRNKLLRSSRQWEKNLMRQKIKRELVDIVKTVGQEFGPTISTHKYR